jgi:REP element-mobilizing transposase RayT
MSRKSREWYPNVAMHITSRGNHRNDIFRDDEDYEFYIVLIEECIKYFNNEFQILGYILMTNHIHLQIQTKEKHIGFFMKRLNNFYAKYFNNKYNYIGHLFQERYGSEIINNDKYMLETSRYIHLNPVRANMVKRPEEYKWSSYSMYIGEDKEKFINSRKILDYFKEDNQRQLYKRFVENGIKVKYEKEETEIDGISS